MSSANSNGGGGGGFPVGAVVFFQGLQSLPTLNGTAGVVVFDSSGKMDGRIAVRAYCDNSRNRYKVENLVFSGAGMSSGPDANMLSGATCMVEPRAKAAKVLP